MAKKRRKKQSAADAQPQRPPRPERGDEAEAVIPRWLPASVFVAITVFLFRDFIFSDLMLVGGDTQRGMGYVARALYADALSSLGRIPGWVPELLGGAPFIDALSAGDSLYPPSVLLLVLLEPYRALGWKLVVHVCAAGFFAFGWLRAIGASRGAALVGGTAYLAAPYLVTLVMPGHDGKIFVTSLAPLLFWAVERHFQRGNSQTVAGIAGVIALVILTTHFQHAYFLFGGVGLFAIFRTWELTRDAGGEEAGGEGPEPDARATVRRVGGLRFATFLGAALLGAGLASVQLLPAVEYVREHSRRVATTSEAAGERGVAWSSSWSMHPEEVMALVIPEFVGNDSGGADWSQESYWGRNLTRDNHPSSGLAILLLAAIGMAGGAQRRMRYFFVGLGSLAVLYGLGANTPLWGLFYQFVPGIRLFRAPDQSMFLFVFSAVTIGALGVDRLLRAVREDTEESWKPVLLVSTVAAGVLFLLAGAAGSGALTSVWTSTVYSSIAEFRLGRLAAAQPFIARGAGIAFLLGLAVLGVAHAAKRSYLAPTGIVAALVVLVAVDEVRIAGGFIQTLDFHEWSQPDPFVGVVQELESGSDEPFRFLSMRGTGQDVSPAMHGLELAAGNHPNDLGRYRELIGMVGSQAPVHLRDHRQIRRLLNVKYTLWPEYQLGPLAGGQMVVRSQFQTGETAEALYQEDPLPRARLVGGATVVPDSDAVAYMRSPTFDPDSEVVLAEPPPIELDGTMASGTVEWLGRTSDRLEWRVQSERPALLVVADNWFPAWRATVDGAEAPVLRAYHTLRAVPIPPGEHTVVMSYRSSSVRRAGLLSGACALLLLGMAGAPVLARRRDAAAEVEAA